jgi:uncharacterized membrane protein YfcA
MTLARLSSVLSVVMVVLAGAAAALNYVNNGRVTWQAVAGLSASVVLALGIRAALAANRRAASAVDPAK